MKHKLIAAVLAVAVWGLPVWGLLLPRLHMPFGLGPSWLTLATLVVMFVIAALWDAAARSRYR